MSQQIYLVRHAEAMHNVNKEYNIPDPGLSEKGMRQCGDLHDHLREHWPDFSKAELIVTSPLRRCLQTTRLGLSSLIESGVPVIARPEWQETTDKPCDTGGPPLASHEEFPEVDFSAVLEDGIYPSKAGPYANTSKAVGQRGINARRWLRSRPEKIIIVVTHLAYLRVGLVSRHFANADYRVFTWPDSPESVEMIEDAMTEGKGGMGRSQKGTFGVEDGEFPGEDTLSTLRQPQPN